MPSLAIQVCSILALVLAWAGPAQAQVESLKGRRPNVILVMTDDQGKGDLSCLGNTILPTPNLDRLYGLSTRFSDFHVSPTCAPTRSAIMTGRHEFKNGVTHTILERERMTLDAVTIAELLQGSGYATGIFGKWHLGDEPAYQPGRRGFDEVFIHGAGGIGQAYPGSCADAPPNQENRYFDPVIRHNGTFVKTQGFCTDVFFQEALRWIDQQRETDQPFFVYLTPNAPHGPMIAPEEEKRPFLEMGYDENTAGRYGMLTNIDDNMGLLMEKMTQWNLGSETLLIFLTDNGQANRSGRLNGQRVNLPDGGLRNGKGSPYEGGTRVPSFWRWPGVLPEGRDIPHLTGHVDLFSTFVELAGVEVPEGTQQTDGRSLLPLLEDPQATWSDRYLFVHRGRWEKGKPPESLKYQYCAVRSEQYRLVNHNELYDIDADPGETTNVFAQHPEIVEQMRSAYEQWWSEARPLMVNEDVPLAPERPYFLEYEQQLNSRGIPAWTSPGY